MDLGKWLRDRKKQVEGVVAQVNPFDGGKTYSSVTRRPTVDPFKSNNVNAKYGVLADKGRRDQFIQNNQRESFSTPIATFQSLRDIPGKIGNTLINNPIADKAADITGTNRQTSVEGRNSSDYLKPTGVIDNTVAAVSNLGQFNPIRSAGDIGQYLDTVSEKSRFKPVGDVIGNQTKDAANFGKPIEGSEWDARNLKNPVAKNAGEFSTMLGQTANFAVPVAGPLAIGGMIANEANETVNTARARGEDETIANLKGLLSGAGQAAVERYSSKLTTALPGSTKLAGLAKNKLIGIPASLAGGAITEGGEEFVQGLMGNAARGNDLTEGLKEQTIQGAKGGLLLGGFFGGANYAANRSQGTTQEAVQRVEQQNPTLQQTGIPAQPGSIRERIQQAKENVKSTIAETNQLLRQDDAGGYMGGTNAQDRINDPLESLKAEARKYGSAEEFDTPVKSSDASMMRLSDEFENFKQTDSIKKWFAGSRATMDGSTDSKPQLFFHRSDADFNEFKKMDDKPDYRDTGEEGIYFSKEPGDEYYGKNEYSVLLNAKKPYRDRNLDTSSLDSDFVEELKSQGYDSIDGADEFIVFEPSQIKIFTKNGKAKGSDLYNEATKPKGPIKNTFDGPLPKKETSDTTLFRSGDIDPKSKRGIFLSNERSNAENYQSTGTGGKTTHEYTLSKDAKMYEAENTTRLLKELRPDIDKNNIIDRYIRQQSQNGEKLIDGLTAEQRADIRVESIIKQELSKRGYDGVSYTGGEFDDAAGEYQLFNSKHLKRVSKLTESDVQRDLEYHFDMLPDKLGREYLPSDMSVIQKNLIDGKPPYDGLTGAAKMPPPKPIKNTFDGPLPKKDPLESLKQEARKYKSAEEFVAAQGTPVYHGTNYANARQIQQTGLNPESATSIKGGKKFVFLTGDEQYAKSYATQKGGDNSFVLSVKKPADTIIEESTYRKGMKFPDLVSQKTIPPEDIIIKGKDGKWYPIKEFNFFTGEADTYIGKTPVVIKTKSQLTDIYNQATQSQPPKSTIESLKQEAGYRSAHQIDNKTARNLGDMQSVDDVVTQIKSKYGLTNNDQKDITNLKRIVGNPEADVKIYRASPVNEVNDGDWVTTSKTYANDIKRQNGGKVYEYTVKAKDLNLPSNIEDNPSLARFSAFQYSPVQKKQGWLRTLMRDEGGGYTGKTSQERIGQAKFDAELRAKSAANLKKANIQITQGVANPKSDSPLTDKAYSETFGVSLEEAKKDITSINTSKTNPLDSVGMTEQEATRKLESNAPTMSPGNKKTKSLVDSMINDKKLTEAARIAQKEGRELNYFAKKDNNGRSVGIEEYNPSRQRIEAGFVVDNSTGKVLGNHIKVDATGTQINVGGEVVNISDVVGNPLDWKGDYEVSSTMERNIFKNAPNKEIAQKTYKFVVANKIQAEATLRKEIESQRKTLNQNVKDVQKVKPWSVSDKDFKADIFDFIENKKSQADIASKYGPKATQAIVKYKNETRKLYDNLLDRANTELAKFGEKTIPKRSDYITHINELNQQPSFAGELMGQLQNSMLGEGYTTTRGGVPGDIAGRTENFSPRKRWNPFAQQRKGGEYTKDPFKAVDSYLEPTLYNIHMTESAVRARAVESAFRTAEILKNTEATKVSTDLDRELEKYKKQSNNAKLVSGFQEYANALAGKTQRWDRQVIDASKGTATALKGWQGLQRIGGRATILGNINSVLMQPLNQASVIAEVKLPNYIKGVASSLAGNNVEDKSPFIRARAAKIESAFRSKGQKVMDKAGIPLQFVELASVKLAWNAEYQQVLSEGLKGQDAIIEADRRTEKAVAGRGIADKPELYRSTLTNGLLQYTLEVNAQNKKFWRDLTPVQKGKFMAAAFGMNTVMEAVTGNEPLPDFLGAAIDTFRDFLDDDDDTPLENAGKGVQRFASEAVSMNPMLSAGANLLPDSTKKTLFGSDSDLTRFEGVPAPIGVIQNAVDVGKNVANGDVKKARDSALKLIPGGNQIRKTLQGKELIQDGGKYDKNGKLQYPAPESPLGKAQALLFGPSAIKNAREYYDSITDKISGISTKKDASGKEIDDFKTIATAAFGTEKGKEFMALTNDDERKEFARQSSENRGIYEQYKSMQKAFNGGDDLLPEGLSKESEAILNKYDRMEAKTKEDIFYRENDAEYKYELAKYEKDKLEGTISEVDAIRKEKSLAKQAIGSKYEKGIRDVYSLSKEQIEDLVTGDPAGKAIYDKLVKYDKELYDAGLISYLKFKNGLASGRGGRGRDKKDTSLTDKYALQGQTLSRLQKLLAGTTFAGAETVTTPKTQKAKQKKITVNMKA